jgi:hypothetical protein
MALWDRAGLVLEVSDLLEFMEMALILSIYNRCDARPHDLDNPNARRRTCNKTDTLIQVYDASILWTDHGIRDDVVVSDTGTAHFPNRLWCS